MAPTGHRLPRMQRQVGYALVEAGLHLLATAGPAQRGGPGPATAWPSPADAALS
jgi:hypothetical protein